MQRIGKKIRVFRELAGVRQGELAKRVGVSPNYISLVENGRREPSLKFLKRLAHEFDLPISVLLWSEIDTENIKDSELAKILESMNQLFWEIIKSKLKVDNGSLSKKEAVEQHR